MFHRSAPLFALFLLAACSEASNQPSASSSAVVSVGSTPSAVASAALSARLAALSSVASASASASAAPTLPPLDEKGLLEAAKAIVEDIGKGNYDGALARCAPSLRDALKSDKLHDAWTKSTGDKGAYEGIDTVSRQPKRGMLVARVRVRLTKGSMDVTLAVSEHGSQPDTLFFGKAQDPWTPASYSDPSKFDAVEVIVGDMETGLPGTLLVPKGDGPFPAAILVHGSGPSDRDESIGPSKPFRDLAEGLASRGVAVLRYEKRTLGHVPDLSINPLNLTVKEEYYDDVKAAVATLSATPKIDAKRLVIVGHSMGAWLTPEFLTQNPSVAAGALLSGNARPMLDLLEPQFTYLAKADDKKVSEAEQASIDKIREQVKNAKAPDLKPDAAASTMPLGLPAVYWLAVRDYDAVKVAKTIAQPLFIAQGERDYQVTAADDFALWKKALKGRKDTTLKLYPKLNHPLIAGDGPSSPADYEVFGHVDGAVVGDLASFILGLATPK
ncbi:MAG: alpha/beta fold hydrolase [Polyangiaceae bacterium]